ncbi:MAG: type II toxin-antitoxin system CcdA family antitoxin [Acetobacteraceae bacterium]|nr:type II toxin-antitoxin system CcdA family antitoxin [Acetobacteraceae bacterium]
MGYDQTAPRQAISLNLNEDLVRCASRLTDSLSSTVEGLLAEFVEREDTRRHVQESHVSQVIAGLNRLYAEHGSIADDFSPL